MGGAFGGVNDNYVGISRPIRTQHWCGPSSYLDSTTALLKKLGLILRKPGSRHRRIRHDEKTSCLSRRRRYRGAGPAAAQANTVFNPAARLRQRGRPEASIDATIDQQISSSRSDDAAGDHSGQGADSQVTLQQINKLKNDLGPTPAALCAGAGQNVSTPAAARISDQALANVTNAQFSLILARSKWR